MKKICLFGTYNLNYVRNSTLRQGLLENGVRVVEVHEEVPNQRMELPEDYTLKTTVARVFRKLGCYVRLAKRYKEVSSSDVIVVLHPGHLDLPLAWLMSKFSGKKLIFDDSISPYDTMFIARSIADRTSLKAKLVKYGERFLTKLADRVFVDTPLMKTFLVSEVGVLEEKIFVIPLGANEKMYKPARIQHTSKNVSVLFFGLYNIMHGTEYIMEAIKILKSKKHISFTLIGEGHLKEKLVAFAKEHKLTNVKFVGFMPEAELVKQIQNADIMLGVFSNSPLFQRVIPNKVFAAIACGKPLITARLKPVSDYLRDKKDVYFCEKKNAGSLADAIETVSEDRSLRETIAGNGYKAFKKNFSTKRIGRKFLEEISI